MKLFMIASCLMFTSIAYSEDCQEVADAAGDTIEVVQPATRSSTGINVQVRVNVAGRRVVECWYETLVCVTDPPYFVVVKSSTFITVDKKDNNVVRGLIFACPCGIDGGYELRLVVQQ